MPQAVCILLPGQYPVMQISKGGAKSYQERGTNKIFGLSWEEVGNQMTHLNCGNVEHLLLFMQDIVPGPKIIWKPIVLGRSTCCPTLPVTEKQLSAISAYNGWSTKV